MMCDVCNVRDAMVMVQQVSNGAKKEIHLCLQCAAQRGLSTSNGRIEMALAGLFDSIATVRRGERWCPVCGTGSGELSKSQRLGCPECYSIFGQELRKMLLDKGVSGVYTGSMPDRLANFRSVLVDRMQLKVKLEQSVAREEYEKAAMYRDRLKALDKCAVGRPDADLSDGGEA